MRAHRRTEWTATIDRRLLLLSVAMLLGSVVAQAQSFSKVLSVSYADLDLGPNNAYERLIASYDSPYISNVVQGKMIVRLRMTTPPQLDTMQLPDSIQYANVLCNIGQKSFCTYLSGPNYDQRFALIDVDGGRIKTIVVPQEAFELPTQESKLEGLASCSYPGSSVIFLIMKFDSWTSTISRICVLDTTTFSILQRYDDVTSPDLVLAANGREVKCRRYYRDSTNQRAWMTTLDLRTGEKIREDPIGGGCSLTRGFIDIGLPSTYVTTNALVHKQYCVDPWFWDGRKVHACLAAPNILLTSRRINTQTIALESYDVLTRQIVRIDEFHCFDVSAMVDARNEQIIVTVLRPDDRVIYSYRDVVGRDGIVVCKYSDTSLVFEASTVTAIVLAEDEQMDVELTSTIGIDWDDRRTKPGKGYTVGTIQNTKLGSFRISFDAINSAGKHIYRSSPYQHVVRRPGKHTFVTNTLSSGKLSMNDDQSVLSSSSDGHSCSVLLDPRVVADTAGRSCLAVTNTSVSVHGLSAVVERAIAQMTPANNGVSVKLLLVQAAGDTVVIDSSTTDQLPFNWISVVSAMADSVLGFKAYNEKGEIAWVRLMKRQNGIWRAFFDSLLIVNRDVEADVPGLISICSQFDLVVFDLRTTTRQSIPISTSAGYLVNDSVVVTERQVWKRRNYAWSATKVVDGGRTYSPIYLSQRYSVLLSLMDEDVGFVVDHINGEVVEKLGPGYHNAIGGVYSSRLHGLFLSSGVTSFVPIVTPVDGVVNVSEVPTVHHALSNCVIARNKLALPVALNMHSCDIYTLQGDRVCTLYPEDEASTISLDRCGLRCAPYVALWHGRNGETDRQLFIVMEQ